MIIVISGRPGSGKTTVAEHLAKSFGLRHASAGDIMREIAEEKGFGSSGREFLKFHEWLKDHEGIDRRIDKRIKEEARRGGVVIDGWIAGWTVKNADIKVYLKTPMDVSAERIAKREDIKSNALEITKKRESSNEKRWKRLYGISINDLNPYHIIIDTSLWDAKRMNQVIEFMITKFMEVRKNG